MLALVLAAINTFSMEDVAHVALEKAKACSQGVRECGGAIYQTRDGAFIASEPLRGRAFGVDLGAVVNTVPEGTHLVADYHIHICSRRNAEFANYFSTADALVNKGFHTVGYMLSLCDNNIRRFDPEEFPRTVMVVQFDDGKELEMPLGHIVGWIP